MNFDGALLASGALEGQVALVTGGGSGIGRDTVLQMVAAGATVVTCGRRLEPVEETAGLCPDGRVDAVMCDIRDEEQVEALVDGALERHGRIDVLVNNAGGQFYCPAEDITPKGFRTVVQLNLEGTWLVTHAVATKAFIPSGRGGKVISITLTPHTGLPGMAHSSAARAGVEGLMRVLAIEWARFGVTLVSVAAGATETDTFLAKYPQQAIEGARASVPLGRLGQAEDISRMVAFLASNGGDYITGTTISIDGGRDVWLGRFPPPLPDLDNGKLVAESRKEKASG